MKQAFISYSLADKDRFVVSRLISELQAQQMQVVTGQNFFSSIIDFTTQKSINTSNLFIGIITDQSDNYRRVTKEWKYAIQQYIPNILIVEDTLSLSNNNYAQNIVRFNRNNIEGAIKSVRQKIQTPPSNNSNSNDWMPWLLGGAAVVAFLSLLGQKSR